MEGLRGYWMRKQYRRLDGSGLRLKKNRVELATLGRTGRRRFWRMKISPKLRVFHLVSPKKLLARLRDAYVRMMLSFAHSPVFSGGFTYGAPEEQTMGFNRPPLKEYDEKLLIQIYKSLVLQQQFMGVRPPPANATDIVCRRLGTPLCLHAC